ncbi:MAG: hypothetical protein ABJC19_11060 [Gemmatimonadota bacterium]
MRTVGIRLAALLGALTVMSCAHTGSSEVRVRNESSAAISVVVTNSAGGAVTITSVASGTESDFVDLPLGSYTVTGSGTGVVVTGTTFVAVGTDNYTIVASAGSPVLLSVKRE